MVQCSYDDCPLQFRTREAMIQHKIKDPDHEYCKRCNVDCDGCEEYLIHQMVSPNHIACPVCGVEFKSTAGRDSHFEQIHRRHQDIACPGIGCNQRFSKAHHLMAHIENDECEKIPLEQFSRQRAEKQLLKDAWHATLDPNEGASSAPRAVSECDTKSAGGGMTLLDDDDEDSDDYPHGGSQHVAGPVSTQPFFAYSANSGSSSRIATRAFETLSLDKFPALPSQKPSRAGSDSNQRHALGSDLMNLDDLEIEHQNNFDPSSGIWKQSETAQISFSQSRGPLGAYRQTSISDNMAMRQGTHSTYDSGNGQTGPRNMFDRISQGPSIPDGLSQARSRAQNSNAHLKTKAPTYLRSNLDPNNYYDHILGAFICPGIKCNGKFNSPEAFVSHLTTGAHAGGRTTCPSCLGIFGSTTALVAHCESGSKKCNIRRSGNYNQVMRELTGGLIGTSGFYDDGTEKYVAVKQQNW